MVGPQTYRRAHVCLSGSIHVFNIVFQPTGLDRLTGINMTSLVNQDPAASDVLGNSADILGDAVHMASDFAGASPLSSAGRDDAGQARPDDTIGFASRQLIARARPVADRGTRRFRPQHQPVSTSLCDTGRDNAKIVRANDPLRPRADCPSKNSAQVLDRHHPRIGLLRSGPLHPRMPWLCGLAAGQPRRRLGQHFFPGE